MISALTGMDIAAANPGAAQGLDSYDASAEASERFQDRYTGQGLADRATELADEATDLEKESKEIADELGGVPTGKAATADDKKKAKELKAKLAAKQAEITAAVKARQTLETEHARFLALDKAVEDLEKAIKQLEEEIDKLTEELDKLAEDEPLEAGGAVPPARTRPSRSRRARPRSRPRPPRSSSSRRRSARRSGRATTTRCAATRSAASST